MGLTRSEDMYLYKFAINKDHIWQVVTTLGKIKGTHFIDMNKNEQVYKYIKSECSRYKVEIISPEDLDQLDTQLQSLCRKRRKAPHMLFEDVENDIKEKQQFIEHQSERINTMHEVLNELQLNKIVLDKTNHLIHGRQLGLTMSTIQIDADGENQRSHGSDDPMNVEVNRLSLGDNRMEQSFREVSISYMAGTVNKDEVERFRRLLYRVSRGKVLSYFENIDENIKDFHGKLIDQSVYLIIFQEGSHFRDKVQKICDSFMGKRVEMPQAGHADKQTFKRKIMEVQKKINDTLQMLKVTKIQMKDYLTHINAESELSHSLFAIYHQFIKKEKAVYQVLNYFAQERNFFHGYLWSYLPKHVLTAGVNRILHSGQDNNNNDFFRGNALQLEEITIKKIKPPTFFKLNAFTEPFQEIVNTYGVPTYKEFNPAVFAIVTFPFLFGVMFGDIGHGLSLFLLSTFLCLLNQRISAWFPELNNVLKVRYMLLMMGLFASYCGFIYNDMMSIPVNLHKSCYEISSNGEKIVNLDKNKNLLEKDCTYYFGVDPIWGHSKNELNFVNSLKMKMAVILGVMQMSLGIFIKALNSLYFKDYLTFFNEFIPQILMMLLLFGYMDLLIIIKWSTDYSGQEHNAPSIITTMINIPLNGGMINGLPFIGSMSTNRAISIIFLTITIICVPWMLFVKPFVLRRRHRNKENRQNQQIEEIELTKLKQPIEHNYNEFVEEQYDGKEDGELEEEHKTQHEYNKPKSQVGIEEIKLENKNPEDSLIIIMGGSSQMKDHSSDENFDFSEIFIHQLIETIEFVLGTISNTASYLRLWALSLAHSQLSKVFFNMTIGDGMNNNSATMIFFSYFIWINATLFILMSMDVLECFLHTLRLHWVEFQNKFYKGQGNKFTPFHFDHIFNKELK